MDVILTPHVMLKFVVGDGFGGLVGDGQKWEAVRRGLGGSEKDHKLVFETLEGLLDAWGSAWRSRLLLHDLGDLQADNG